MDIFETVAWHISPDGAMTMLEKMRRNWNSVPGKKIDFNSWYTVICNLVTSLNRSPTARKRFREKYPNLLCLEPIHTIHDRNRRGQARAWMSSQETPYRLVQSAFGRLGYATLEQTCDEHGGFVVDDNPNSIENRCFEILESLVSALHAGFFLRETAPTQKVIRNHRAAYHGMATVHKDRRGKTNNRGLAIRYDIGEIYLKESVFTADGFFDALATYIHESCHTFGGDSSESFSRVLTHATETLLTSSEFVTGCGKRWRDLVAASELPEGEDACPEA